MEINTAKTLILAAAAAFSEEVNYSLTVGKVTIASYRARVAQRAQLIAECHTAMEAAVGAIGRLAESDFAALKAQPAVRSAMSVVAGWQKQNLQTAGV
jgi:hypothetical protein